jgi:hypothetical protein
MNERIKELAREAGLLAHNPEGVPTKLETFAELIVRECARVAFESDLTMAIGQWGADSAILKHFGVEE